MVARTKQGLEFYCVLSPMAEHFRDYKSYVRDPELARKYSDYQSKYADNPRESNKKSAPFWC